MTSESADAVSASTVAFLAELARLPAIQEGDVEAVAQFCCTRCLDLIDTGFVSVWMFNTDRTILRSIVRYDAVSRQATAPVEITAGDLAGEFATLRTSTLIVSDDALNDTRLAGIRDSYLRPLGLTALLDHVIRVSGEDVGLLSFEQVGSPRPWLPSESALARGICSYLALATVNQKRRQADLALRDSEAKRRQSEEILSRVFLQSPDAILITALSNGRILEANPGFEQITGYTRAEAIGRTTIDLAIWVDQAERDAMLAQVRSTGEVHSLNIRINHRAGGKRDCVLWGRTFDFEGVPALLTSVHDITDMRHAAQSASDSQRMLQAVLDAVPSHVFWKDTNSVYLGCNRQFALDNGFADPSEIVGTTDYDQLTGNSPEQLAEIQTVLAADRQLVASKQPTAPRNALFVKADGTVHWMNVTKTPLLDSHGNVIGILGVQHDVTEILESEKAARDSQQMLQSVLDTIPSRVFWKDRNSVYLGSNRQYAEESGLADPRSIVGKVDSELSWRADAEKFVAADRQVIATGQPILDQLISFITKTGEKRWVESDKVPLLTDTGEIKGVLGVQHDITDQLRRQEELRASEQKLRALFDLSPFGINLQDMDGHYLEANAAFLDIVGFSLDEITKLTCYDIIPAEYLDAEPERLRQLRETGLIPAYEKEYRRKDGSLVPISTATVLIPGSNGQHFKWTIVENITERRKAEAAQRRLNDDLEHLVAERTAELKAAMEGLMRAEKLASLGSLVAGVAHEISTPVGNASLATSTLVNAIQDFERQMAEKMSRSQLEMFVKQIKLGVDIANRNIERVAGLIQSFKQVAVDQTSSQRRKFHLTEVVDEILTTMHPSLKRRTVTIAVSIPPDLVLDSYPGPLGQVLTNLINNSLVHAFPNDAPVKEKPRTIRIKAVAVDPALLRLEVSDNGSGMAATVLGRIFDPFFTSRLGHGGSGLGLHIVHSIVADMLAGTVTVASTVGEGTTFTITMPCQTPAPATVDAEETSE